MDFSQKSGKFKHLRNRVIRFWGITKCPIVRLIARTSYFELALLFFEYEKLTIKFLPLQGSSMKWNKIVLWHKELRNWAWSRLI